MSIRTVHAAVLSDSASTKKNPALHQVPVTDSVCHPRDAMRKWLKKKVNPA
ncbi:Uncharacterized protein {ECO:0000313/EMBL:CCF09061.1} [Pantoea ananatis]|nr:Uncharacterized protein {ECO:0000313/EMBL:CCF09061.1} [Pantoea ananatis]